MHMAYTYATIPSHTYNLLTCSDTTVKAPLSNDSSKTFTQMQAQRSPRAMNVCDEAASESKISRCACANVRGLQISAWGAIPSERYLS